MKGRDLGLLLALGAMWGSSFLFIKVAVDEVSPAFIVACRLFFAVLTLLAAAPFLARLSGRAGETALLRDVARLWRPLLVLGFFNAALPFLVISWGTQFLPSGTAAILNSTVPLFTALLAGLLPFFADERLGLVGAAGILVGLLGVGVLAGGFGDLDAGFASALVAAGAILLGSVSYAIGALFARWMTVGVPVTVSAVGQNLGGLVLILPLALFSTPTELPGPIIVGSLVGLGAIGTGFSLLIYFRLIENVGATRTATVTYLVPVWALFYGALLLGEEITARAVLGLALILLGVAGISGFRYPPKRTPEGPPAP